MPLGRACTELLDAGAKSVIPTLALVGLLGYPNEIAYIICGTNEDGRYLTDFSQASCDTVIKVLNNGETLQALDPNGKVSLVGRVFFFYNGTMDHEGFDLSARSALLRLFQSIPQDQRKDEWFSPVFLLEMGVENK